MTGPLAGCFVTGTDTGIGKTRAAVALLHACAARGRRVAGMKPVASGCTATAEGLRNDDALALRAASAGVPDYALVNPYAYAPPIAPHIAAQATGRAIDFGVIEACAHRLAAATAAEGLVVEGVGGWRVPLGPDGDVAALAVRLGLPVVLVVGLRLGCINHARLSAEAIVATGAPYAGWIANRIDPDMLCAGDSLAALREALPGPCLGTLPWMPAPRPQALAAALDPLPLLSAMTWVGGAARSGDDRDRHRC